MCLHNDKRMWLWWPDACLRWSAQTSTNVQNSQANTAATLADCYAACFGLTTCTGVVYVFTGTSGQRCKLQTPTATQQITGSAPGTYRYPLERTCRGNNEFTGQLAQPTLALCELCGRTGPPISRGPPIFAGADNFYRLMCIFIFDIIDACLHSFTSNNPLCALWGELVQDQTVETAMKVRNLIIWLPNQKLGHPLRMAWTIGKRQRATPRLFLQPNVWSACLFFALYAESCSCTIEIFSTSFRAFLLWRCLYKNILSVKLRWSTRNDMMMMMMMMMMMRFIAGIIRERQSL